MSQSETNEVVYIIGGIILALMNGVIGYFLKDAAKSLKELSKAIVDLQISFSREKATTESIRIQCAREQTVVDARLTDHGKRLDVHEIDLAILKDREAKK